jgi:hypothetical protein
LRALLYYIVDLVVLVLQFVISTHLVYYFIVVILICIGCDPKVSREVISLGFRDSSTKDCFVWKGYQLILIFFEEIKMKYINIGSETLLVQGVLKEPPRKISIHTKHKQECGSIDPQTE